LALDRGCLSAEAEFGPVVGQRLSGLVGMLIDMKWPLLFLNNTVLVLASFNVFFNIDVLYEEFRLKLC